MNPAPEIEDVLALSPLQQGMFALAELADGGLDLYTMQFVVEIGGDLDTERLRRSVQALLDRHPNLRMSVWDRGVPHPVQVVPARARLPWEQIVATADEFDKIASAERLRPFDLRSGPLLRVMLVGLPGYRWRMILTAHHVLMDGWAVALFFQELLTVYDAGGRTDGLAPIRPYRNYIAWLAAQDSDAARETWRMYLDGVEPLMLASSSVMVTEPVRHRHRLPVDETGRLLRWARSCGLTVNTVVQYAWAYVLGRLSDRDDVVFGVTVSGRPQSLPDADRMIGLFINTVPSRVRLDGGQTVVQQCIELQRESGAMRDRGYLGLSEIQRATGTPALFDTLYVFENAPIGAATQPVTAADGTRFLPLAMESLAHYPLTIVAHVIDGELIIITEAVEGALGEIDAAQIGERIVHVLRQISGDVALSPDSLDALLPAEHRMFSTELELSGSDAEVIASTVTSAFVTQCRATPHATAVVAAQGIWTYGELGAAAARLARELEKRGVGPESVVALALPRSVDSIVAIFAVFLAGGAYVPVDPALPDQRLEVILRRSRACVVLTCGGLATRIGGLTTGDLVVLDDRDTAERIAQLPSDLVMARTYPQSSAYVIFTSGSTGEPKGVIGTQAALLSYCIDHRDRMLQPARAELGRPLRVAHAWTLGFDASWQPMAALLDGHAIHLFDEDDMRDAGKLVAGLVDRQIDLIDTTPSMFGKLAEAGLVGSASNSDANLKVLALGGEAIGPRLWEVLKGLQRTTVHNCYGPTETTVEAMVARVADSPTPTIGAATDRMRSYVLDSRLRPSPTGVDGELYLSGAQVTRGYCGQAGMTAAHFVADPRVPGGRMYRTGDMVRRNAVGDHTFVGRSDNQVKIRGFRIEIAEIEAAIRNLAGVQNSAVVVVQREIGPALVGFATGDVADRSLRAEVSDVLPAHMVPVRIVALPMLPMNQNGKLDTGVLEASARAALRSNSTALEELTVTESIVRDALSDILGLAPGADEDFFDLGVDSIVAMTVVHRLREHALEVTPRMVLTYSTVRDLARAIANPSAAENAASAGFGLVPALPVVESMYEFGNFRRFTQTVLFRLPDNVTDQAIMSVIGALLDRHDTLRAVLTADGLRTREPGTVEAESVVHSIEVLGSLSSYVKRAARMANELIDPMQGAMMVAIRLRCTSPPDMLLVAIHHLAVDAVSWQILFEDIADVGVEIDRGQPARVLPERSDYRVWCEYVRARADDPAAISQVPYWAQQIEGADPAIGARRPDPRTDTWKALKPHVALTDVGLTQAILEFADRTVGLREFLLSALTLTLADWRRRRGEDPAGGAFVALEGHGREDALSGAGMDTTRTLGWFTSVFPVRLGKGVDVDIERVASDPGLGQGLISGVAATLADIPFSGIDFGVLKYLRRVPVLVRADEPQVEFNYLGRYDLRGSAAGQESWSPVLDLDVNAAIPSDPEPELPLRYAVDLVVVVRGTAEGPQLVANWRYNSEVLTAGEVTELGETWLRAVEVLATAWGKSLEVMRSRS